jgi:hypothetical protein
MKKIVSENIYEFRTSGEIVKMGKDVLLDKKFKKILNKTINSYSFNLYYNEETWLKIINLLYCSDFSEEAIILILKSKFMRWFADEIRGNRRVLDDPGNNPVHINYDEFVDVYNEWNDKLMDFVFEEIGIDAHEDHLC